MSMGGGAEGARHVAVAIIVAMAAAVSTGSRAAAQPAPAADTTSVRYWVRLGTTLQQAGKLDEALVAYRRAAGMAPAPIAAYNMGTIYAKRGQKDSAFRWLGESVTLGFASEPTVQGDNDLASIRSDVRYAALIERIRDAMRPCMSRKESRMFDFWVGDWDVKTAQGQMAGQSSVQLLLEGCALLENWTDSQNGHGKSLNSYNADKRMWQQFWTDQYGRVTEYRESEWRADTLRYLAHQVMPRGPALIHMSFVPMGRDTVRQWGEISYDEGKTWVQSFDLRYYRKKP